MAQAQIDVWKQQKAGQAVVDSWEHGGKEAVEAEWQAEPLWYRIWFTVCISPWMRFRDWLGF
jgi:hypothetical protein